MTFLIHSLPNDLVTKFTARLGTGHLFAQCQALDGHDLG